MIVFKIIRDFSLVTINGFYLEVFMTSIGDIGSFYKSDFSSQGFMNAGSSSILSSIGGDSPFSSVLGTTPMGELGMLSSINEPVDLANLAMYATPFGPAYGVMQMLGLPPISELLKNLGIDKLLDKIPGLSSLTKGIGDVAKGITKGIGGVAKKVGGAVKSIAKKL